MNFHQLYLKDNNNPIFTGFTTALMRAYSLADKGNQAILAKAFPEYFMEKIEPELLKNILGFSKQR